MKNRTISFVCAAAMLASMSACGSTAASETQSQETTAAVAFNTVTEAAQSELEISALEETSEYASQTLTGQVQEVSEESITLLLGELSENAGGDGQQPPEMPTEGQDTTGTEQQPTTAEGQDTTGAEQQPPEMPENQDGNGDGTQAGQGGGEPPEAPAGGAAGGFTAGEETVTLTVAAEAKEAVAQLAVGDVVQVTTDESGAVISAEAVSAGGMGGQLGGFGGSGEVTQGTAANTIDQDGEYTDETYTSTGDDENALRVDGATVTLDGITVDKSAGATSNTENGDFYGQNAALLATNGATVTIQNATVTSSAQNGNGVFSYGEGTTVNISDSTITTTADNSGGIQTTGGGTTNASNLTVDTSGNSAAAIRSDRGGGTVNVDGGTYTSNGYNSPAVYSTAAITVKNAQLTANSSEALVIEGQNSITLEDCDVSGNMSDTEGTSSDENVHNVMIYQSMSGDAEVGTSTFSMTGGTLTSHNGDLFYITNTHCLISLSQVDIVNEDSDGYLMRVTGNSASHGWGTAGANGAQVELTAADQALEGDIVVDSISTLDMTLTDGSSFTGTVNITENAQGGTAVENNAVITLEAGCTWTLTGDCTITSLVNNGTINFNGYTITLSDGTVLSE